MGFWKIHSGGIVSFRVEPISLLVRIVPHSNIQNDHKGTLILYFVPSGNYDAKIGNTESWHTPQWTADIPPKAADLLAKQIKLPKSAIPEGARVATFVDYDFPRPAKDDIYFTKNGSLSPKEFPSRSSQMIIAYATSLLFTGLVLLALVKRPRPAV